MMLDMKRTFDEVVEAHSTPDKAAQILANPFYQSVSSSFAGTQEYMAMEKLGQLRAEAEREGTWDLIVVDTPPSRSALDFLDAPKRLGSFLDGRFIRLLTAPARAGGRAYLKVFSVGATITAATISKVLGGQLLADVQTFVAALDTMFGGFRERADVTYALLKEPATAFVVVAAPERDALREAAYFVDRLESEGMPLAGVVVNRMQTLAAPALSGSRARRGRRAARGPRRRRDRRRPGRPHRRRCCACTPTSPRWPPGTRGTCAGSWRAPRGAAVDGAGERHRHPRPRGAAHGRRRAGRRLSATRGTEEPRGADPSRVAAGVSRA